MALEVIGERWTLLVVRELICGSRRFSEIHRGVPLMSKSVLTQRLKSLVDAGVIEHLGGDYLLTEAGRELTPIVMACGEWGVRWAHRKLADKDVDVTLLMWDLRRRIETGALPERELWVEFEFRRAPQGRGKFWLHIDAGEVELCLTNPRRDVTLKLMTTPRIMAEVWTGEVSFAQALRAGDISLEGPRDLVRAFPRALERSVFADVKRPASA